MTAPLFEPVRQLDFAKASGLKPYWFWILNGTADGSRSLTTRAVPYKDLGAAAQAVKRAPPAQTPQAEARAT